MADNDTATKRVRAKVDKFLEQNRDNAFCFFLLNKEQQAEMKRLILSLWDSLAKENPDLFWEQRKKTMDLAKDADGRLLQKVVVRRLAIQAYVSSPFEDGEVFDEVERREEWVAIEERPHGN